MGLGAIVNVELLDHGRGVVVMGFGVVVAVELIDHGVLLVCKSISVVGAGEAVIFANNVVSLMIAIVVVPPLDVEFALVTALLVVTGTLGKGSEKLNIPLEAILSIA